MVIGTPNFPNNIDDADCLIRAANNVAPTTTNEAGGAGANSTGGTTITVASTTAAPAFPSSGTISIDNEVITYSGKTATTFTGCVRGADGTTAAVHTAVGAVVNHYDTALHHTVLANSLIATQTKLGYGASVPAANQAFLGFAAGISFWAPQTRLLLNYTAVGADLANAVAIAAFSWTTLATLTTTLQPTVANSQILVSVRGAAQLIPSSTAQVASRLLVDGTIPYPIFGNTSVGAVATQVLGGAMFTIGSQTVANHTLQIQLLSGAAGTYYCRSNSDSTFEWLYCEVWEFVA